MKGMIPEVCPFWPTFSPIEPCLENEFAFERRWGVVANLQFTCEGHDLQDVQDESHCVIERKSHDPAVASLRGALM